MTNSISPNCECARYPALSNIPMGYRGDDQRFFASVSRVQEHGGNKWWLWLGQCNACHQHWIVVQDARIFDEYLVKPLSRSEAISIQNGVWPTDFLTYESVLRELGKRCQFCTWADLNESPLAYTINELRQENPALSLQDAAALVGIDKRQLGRLKF